MQEGRPRESLVLYDAPIEVSRLSTGLVTWPVYLLRKSGISGYWCQRSV